MHVICLCFITYIDRSGKIKQQHVNLHDAAQWNVTVADQPRVIILDCWYFDKYPYTSCFKQN